MPEAVAITHENVAVGMAHGYYKITGRPQAVMFHVNVGTANALMGLDQAGMLREVVKWDYELRYGEQIEAMVDRALVTAMSEPKGPVYLSLPREALADPFEGRAIQAKTTMPVPAPGSPNQEAGDRSSFERREPFGNCRPWLGRDVFAVGSACRSVCAAGGAFLGITARPAERPSATCRLRCRRLDRGGRCHPDRGCHGALDTGSAPSGCGLQGHPAGGKSLFPGSSHAQLSSNARHCCRPGQDVAGDGGAERTGKGCDVRGEA